MSNLGDYMKRGDGEAVPDYIERIVREFVFARGGNHPADVRRWLSEPGGVDRMVDLCWDLWGLDQPDPVEYREATEEDVLDEKVTLLDEAGDPVPRKGLVRDGLVRLKVVSNDFRPASSKVGFTRAEFGARARVALMRIHG